MTHFSRALVLLLSLPLFAATTAPYLVKDLPGPINARGSLGALWVTIGDTSWFTADRGDGLGRQVWKTDGIEHGTVRVTSVVTPSLHAETFLGVINGHLLYGGHDGVTQGLISLNMNGGTPETLVREQFGARGVVYEGALYLAASATADGGAKKGIELWRTDGTLDGTTFVDLNPGTASSLTSQSLVLAGGWLLFVGETPAGKGLYRTDGTLEGTTKILSFDANVEPHEAQLTQFGDRAVFVLPHPGVDNDQLFVTDGTEDGTQPIVERMRIFTPGGVLGGRLIFTMRTLGGQITMWTTNGTPAGTQRLNDHSGSFGTVGLPGAVVGDRYFFFGLDPQTSQSALFTTGALPGTTQKVKDLDTLRSGGSEWNGRFFFSNRDASHGTEWWVSDGTPSGTFMIEDLAVGSRDGVISEQMLQRPDGLLVGVDGPAGHEPWIINGTPGQSRILRNIAADTPLPGSNPEKLRAAGNRLFFLADAPGYRVVGRSNGYTEGTTAEVITPTDEWWFADAFGSGARYYLKSSVDLLSTDGTPQGTQHLSSNAGSAVAFRGGVVFEERSDNTFHFSDGTAVGTNTIARLAGPPPAAWKLYAANDLVWFTNGSTLAVSDGFSPMRRIIPLSGTIGPIREVVQGHDTAYFVDENLDEKRLWRTDGTNEGTRIVRIFTQIPINFIATSDRLLFTQNLVLWSTDGTTANTVSLGAPGASVSCPFGSGSIPVVTGNQLFWYVRRNDGTSALWKSNGTFAGTTEVASFAPSSSQGCVTMAALDGQIYFRGFDTAHGTEPWISDGTSAGTRLLTDIYPGTTGSDPQELTTAGNHLFFSAETPDRGRELWAVRKITRRRAADH